MQWSRVNIPRQGDIGNWVLAKDTDISCLTIADEDTMYCSANPTGIPYRFFKSNDKGQSWRYTAGIENEIVDIAAISGNPDTLYYTDGISVYKSIDGGTSFIQMPPLPVTTGTGGLYITSISVVRDGSDVVIAAGTSDSDISEYGGVYLLTDNTTNPSWENTAAGNCDVYEVMFSPQYNNDKLLFTVVSDEIDTFLISKSDEESWNQSYQQVTITGLIPVSAAIAFPDLYNGVTENFTLYAGINTGAGLGDVFRIDYVPSPEASVIADLDMGIDYGIDSVDVASLVAGINNGIFWLFAGDYNSATVFRSADAGDSWTRSVKPSTGQGNTQVRIDKEFSVNGYVYTATSGQGSAFSRSIDGGITFNQISLIDTEISLDCYNDFAPSPHYSTDGTMFLLSVDTSTFEHCIWRSINGSSSWERIQSSFLYTDTYFRGIAVPPDYDPNNNTVFMYGTSECNPVIWKSTDNGQTFAMYPAPSPFIVDTWNIINSSTVYIGCNNGIDSLVYKTENGGQTWMDGIKAGQQTLNAIRISPDFINDSIMMVSNLNGWVYYSDDGGRCFRPLPLDAVTPPFNSFVNIEFDPRFSENKMVYAVSDSAGEGIYRFIMGQSENWEKIDNRLSPGALITGIKITGNGVMYALNSQIVELTGQLGGLERSLNPSCHLLPSFETVLNGLEDDILLRGLWNSGNRIWSIDTVNNRLLTMLDTMSQPVRLFSPVQDTPVMDAKDILLDWEVMEGATEYEWQVDFTGAFSSIPSGFTGCTGASSVYLPELELNTRYYWRVRATKPVESLWSERRSFTPVSGKIPAGPTLLSPDAGRELENTKPVFQWNPVPGMNKYELMVSKDPSFKNTNIRKTGTNALSANAWQSDIVLDSGSTYYWKVRGVNPPDYTEWSAVGAFLITPLVEPVVEEVKETEALSSVTLNPISAAKPALLSPSKNPGITHGKPLFQWESVTGADGYELIVAADDAFRNLVITKTGEYFIPNPAWKSNVNLDSENTYYWKVRGVTDDGFSEWSEVGAFTVESSELVSDNISKKEEIQGAMTVTLDISSALPKWAIVALIGLLTGAGVLQTVTLLVMAVTQRKNQVIKKIGE